LRRHAPTRPSGNRRFNAKKNTHHVKLLICKTIVGTRLSNQVRETLKGSDLELFDTSVSQRVAFIEAMIAGWSVLEYAPSSTAAKEILSLRDEIMWPATPGP